MSCNLDQLPIQIFLQQHQRKLEHYQTLFEAYRTKVLETVKEELLLAETNKQQQVQDVGPKVQEQLAMDRSTLERNILNHHGFPLSSQDRNDDRYFNLEKAEMKKNEQGNFLYSLAVLYNLRIAYRRFQQSLEPVLQYQMSYLYVMDTLVSEDIWETYEVSMIRCFEDFEIFLKRMQERTNSPNVFEDLWPIQVKLQNISKELNKSQEILNKPIQDKEDLQEMNRRRFQLHRMHECFRLMSSEIGDAMKVWFDRWELHCTEWLRAYLTQQMTPELAQKIEAATNHYLEVRKRYEDAHFRMSQKEHMLQQLQQLIRYMFDVVQDNTQQPAVCSFFGNDKLQISTSSTSTSLELVDSLKEISSFFQHERDRREQSFYKQQPVHHVWLADKFSALGQAQSQLCFWTREQEHVQACCLVLTKRLERTIEYVLHQHLQQELLQSTTTQPLSPTFKKCLIWFPRHDLRQTWWSYFQTQGVSFWKDAIQEWIKRCTHRPLRALLETIQIRAQDGTIRIGTPQLDMMEIVFLERDVTNRRFWNAVEQDWIASSSLSISKWNQILLDQYEELKQLEPDEVVLEEDEICFPKDGLVVFVGAEEFVHPAMEPGAWKGLGLALFCHTKLVRQHTHRLVFTAHPKNLPSFFRLLNMVLPKEIDHRFVLEAGLLLLPHNQEVEDYLQQHWIQQTFVNNQWRSTQALQLYRARISCCSYLPIQSLQLQGTRGVAALVESLHLSDSRTLFQQFADRDPIVKVLEEELRMPGMFQQQHSRDWSKYRPLHVYLQPMEATNSAWSVDRLRGLCKLLFLPNAPYRFQHALAVTSTSETSLAPVLEQTGTVMVWNSNDVLLLWTAFVQLFQIDETSDAWIVFLLLLCSPRKVLSWWTQQQRPDLFSVSAWMEQLSLEFEEQQVFQNISSASIQIPVFAFALQTTLDDHQSLPKLTRWSRFFCTQFGCSEVHTLPSTIQMLLNTMEAITSLRTTTSMSSVDLLERLITHPCAATFPWTVLASKETLEESRHQWPLVETMIWMHELGSKDEVHLVLRPLLQNPTPVQCLVLHVFQKAWSRADEMQRILPPSMFGPDAQQEARRLVQPLQPKDLLFQELQRTGKGCLMSSNGTISCPTTSKPTNVVTTTTATPMPSMLCYFEPNVIRLSPNIPNNVSRPVEFNLCLAILFSFCMQWLQVDKPGAEQKVQEEEEVRWLQHADKIEHSKERIDDFMTQLQETESRLRNLSFAKEETKMDKEMFESTPTIEEETTYTYSVTLHEQLLLLLQKGEVLQAYQESIQKTNPASYYILFSYQLLDVFFQLFRILSSPQLLHKDKRQETRLVVYQLCSVLKTLYLQSKDPKQASHWLFVVAEPISHFILLHLFVFQEIETMESRLGSLAPSSLLKQIYPLADVENRDIFPGLLMKFQSKEKFLKETQVNKG